MSQEQPMKKKKKLAAEREQRNEWMAKLREQVSFEFYGKLNLFDDKSFDLMF